MLIEYKMHPSGTSIKNALVNTTPSRPLVFANIRHTSKKIAVSNIKVSRKNVFSFIA
jgi:hypothetical protein